MKKEVYDITGMTCSACSARIEKGMGKLEGIDTVSVNLLKNSMSITYEENLLNPASIIANVEEIGYGAVYHGSKTKPGGKPAERMTPQPKKCSR